MPNHLHLLVGVIFVFLGTAASPSLADSVFSINLTPGSPPALKFHEKVKIDFDYKVDSPGGAGLIGQARFGNRSRQNRR